MGGVLHTLSMGASARSCQTALVQRVQSLLKAAGFTRKGLTWYRADAELIFIFSFSISAGTCTRAAIRSAPGTFLHRQSAGVRPETRGELRLPADEDVAIAGQDSYRVSLEGKQGESIGRGSESALRLEVSPFA